MLLDDFIGTCFLLKPLMKLVWKIGIAPYKWLFKVLTNSFKEDNK